MNTRVLTVVVLVLVDFSLLSLTPSAAFAQAGLSGNALEGQAAERQGMDNGRLKSQSALGQLEELSGGKVDRSSNSSSNRNSTTRPVQQPRPPKPRYNADQVLKQELAGALAGALVGALFNNLLNDNSAQQRAQAEAAAAARAAAEAEAFRVQQELARLARIQKAQSYRADWDAREGDIADRLGGAFDVHAGTAFFGIPANPDADTIAALIGQPTSNTNPAATEPPDASNIPDVPDVAAETETPDLADSDPSVVDLRGSSLIVQPPGSGVVSTQIQTRSSGSLMPRWAYEWAEPPPPRRKGPSELEQLFAYFNPQLGEWYKETVFFGTIKSTFWGAATKLPGGKIAKKLVESKDQVDGLTEELGGMYGEQYEKTFEDSMLYARALGNQYNSGSQYLEYDNDSLAHSGRKMTAEIYKIAFNQHASQVEAPDAAELFSSPQLEVSTYSIHGRSDPNMLHFRQSVFGSGGR